MDGLIAIIVIIWIASAISGNKKKAKNAKKAGGVQRAAQPKAKTQVPPQPKAPPKPKQARIPYTKEEWADFLNDLNEEIAPKKAAPRLVTEMEMESASMEGESHEEHAEHLRRIEAEEAQHRQEREAIEDLRAANREKLRAAVVMSEVLGKPVALRPRIGYHR